MQEITDAILRKNLTTEPAIEKLFEIHIDRNRDNLDEVIVLYDCVSSIIIELF